ncbi:hypothetical protein ACFL6W_01105 [Thermodesulfobacteriota bacterium]
MNRSLKLFGIPLLIGGVLLILLNIFLTPQLPLDQDEAVLRTSTVYLLRLSVAGVSAMLLLFGCIGVYLAHRNTAGVFGTAAFLIAFVGNSLLVCIEWSNLFVLRAVAQSDPEALSALDKSALMDIGFASAAGLFAIGWILMAVSSIKSKVFARWIPITVIAGLVLIPALGATPLGLTGAIVGNTVFGLGIAAMGWNLAKDLRKGVIRTERHV